MKNDKIVTLNGMDISYRAAEMLMDDDIREELHREMAPCSEEEFLAAYCKAHEAKFGEKFRVD